MKALLILLFLITLSSCLVQKQVTERYKITEDEECILIYDIVGQRTICTCPTIKDALLLSKALNHYMVNPLYDNPNITVFK